jgi:hypothetical protein
MKITTLKVTASVPLKDYKKFVHRKVIKDYKTLYPELFESPDMRRIAFKITGSFEKEDDDFVLPDEIKNYLKNLNYELSPGESKKARFKGTGEFRDINKILAKQKDKKAQDMLKMFNLENQKFLKQGSDSVWCIVSRYARDYLGQSYDKGWTSCKEFGKGIQRSFLSTELTNGFLCAYFVRSSFNINSFLNRSGKLAEKQVLQLIDSSMGRTLIIPYSKQEAGNRLTILIASETCYGHVSSSARAELQNWLNIHYNNTRIDMDKKQVIYHPGDSISYNDSRSDRYFTGITKQNIESLPIEEMLTVINFHRMDRISWIKDEYLQKMIAYVFPTTIIQGFKNPSDTLQLLAFERRGELLNIMEMPAEPLLLKIVKRHPTYIKFILSTLPESVCVEALKQKVTVFQHIKDPSKELCLLALSLCVKKSEPARTKCLRKVVPFIEKWSTQMVKLVKTVDENFYPKAKDFIPFKDRDYLTEDEEELCDFDELLELEKKFFRKNSEEIIADAEDILEEF